MHVQMISSFLLFSATQGQISLSLSLSPLSPFLIFRTFPFQFLTLPLPHLPRKMDQNQETDKLSQMRKSLQNLGSSTETYREATLKRFLVARSMNPNKAAKMFVQWHKWRTSFVPLGFIPDSEVIDELETRKIFLQGLSKQGLPVLLFQAYKHFPAKDQLQFKKFVVHLLDKAIQSSFKGREIGDEKLLAILDLKKISYKNVDVRGFVTGFQFLQGYYPERLGKLFILNMPWFFVSVWRAISRFLEKATLDKIVIISNEDEMREVINEVGEEVVPEEYGGKAKLVALQDVVVRPLAE